MPEEIEMRLLALRCLAERDAKVKSAAVRRLAQDSAAGVVGLDAVAMLTATQFIPGYPDKPALVSPREVARRAMNTPEGRAAMVHAMAHIEFNAINLALDAIWRFQGMPNEYYIDWLRVAEDEALHFDLLSAHLEKLGYAYGDFPAHNGLWDWVEKTQHDLMARMALLPRTMEARGLDVTPGMKAKLVQAGDDAIGVIMDVILRDEIGHVAIGIRWFDYLCDLQELESVATYHRIVTEYGAQIPRGPFNLEARRAAGFSERELESLKRPAA